MRTGFLISLIVVLVVIGLVLILGISLGIGWVLTLFLPFSLFEGALLSMIAGLASGALWYMILFSALAPEFGGEENEIEDEAIPESRFWQTSGQRTWKNLFRYVLANSIYEDVVESRDWIGDMDEGQQQELSIRLADAALGALKRRARQAKRLRVTRGVLRQQLVNEGQRPYEDELLDLAVAAVNAELVYLEEDLKEVARGRMWDQKADVLRL